MRSHRYEFSKADLFQAALAPLLIVSCLIIAAHVLRITHVLDGVETAEYMDDIVLTQRSKAPGEASNPQILFVGDSSCLVDFSARELQSLVGGIRCYNLGTLSTLGLPKFAEFTTDFLAVQTNVNVIVLLISPEMVRSGSSPIAAPAPLPAEWGSDVAGLKAEGERARQLLEKAEKREALFANALALPFLKTQFLARVFEKPYDTEFGFTFGFPSGIREYMEAHNGSALDPTGEYKPPTARSQNIDHANGFADEPFRQQCEDFRKSIPANVKLWIALSPEPASLCSPNRPQEIARTLLTLKNYLRAEAVLTNLPVTLPDHYFSTPTHLNPAGAQQFTHALAGAIKTQVQATPLLRSR